MIYDFIIEYLSDVFDSISPQSSDYLMTAVSLFLIQLFVGGLIQLLFSAVGLIYNIRGVRKK